MKKKSLEYKVDNNGCHICISHAPNGDGYPYIRVLGKSWRAARLIYTEKVGKIPDNLIIRHTCDNRLCINTEHLILGTKADNNRDRAERGRNADQSGENSNSAKLTKEQVLEIRVLDLTEIKIAKIYNVSRGLIGRIKRYEVWKNI